MFLSCVVLISTFVTFVLSSPLLLDQREQAVLSSPRTPDKPEYKNGETPPVENTVGWIDPRLNGGRFLDVRNHM